MNSNVYGIILWVIRVEYTASVELPYVIKRSTDLEDYDQQTLIQSAIQHDEEPWNLFSNYYELITYYLFNLIILIYFVSFGRLLGHIVFYKWEITFKLFLFCSSLGMFISF